MPAPSTDSLLYRRILLVVDLSDDSRTIGARARAVAAACGAEVSLLHEVEEELVKRAGTRLAELARELGLGAAACRVEAGNTKAEIVRVATETKSDLVVLGSRERHGLSILVNLTEDTVLHAAPCDVLAVRIR